MRRLWQRPGPWWPVLLILAGLVSLASQLGLVIIHWAEVWRAWPVVLLLLGAYLALGRPRAGVSLIFLLCLTILVSAALFGLRYVEVRAFPWERETVTYPAEGIRQARIHLYARYGRLRVARLERPAPLLEAVIGHDPSRNRVEPEIQVRGGQAQVSLRTSPPERVLPVLDRREEWEVQLSPAIPLDLSIDAGANDLDLDLAGLTLERLHLNAGVGDVHIALAETGSYTVSVDAGVGVLALHVPEGMAARIRVHRGLGPIEVSARFPRSGGVYETPGYATAAERVEIDIDGGIGPIRIR